MSGKPSAYHLETIAQLREELESWRMSLSDTGFRPGGLVRLQAVTGARTQPLALYMHYMYYSFAATLARTALLYLPESRDADVLAQRCENTTIIIQSTRSVLDLTALIEVEPYTPSL